MRVYATAGGNFKLLYYRTEKPISIETCQCTRQVCLKPSKKLPVTTYMGNFVKKKNSTVLYSCCKTSGSSYCEIS